MIVKIIPPQVVPGNEDASNHFKNFFAKIILMMSFLNIMIRPFKSMENFPRKLSNFSGKQEISILYSVKMSGSASGKFQN